MATASIDVTSHVRDRIHDRARAQGIPPAVFVERLLDEHDRAERIAAARAAYALLSEDDTAAESAEWDAAGEDGLVGA